MVQQKIGQAKLQSKSGKASVSLSSARKEKSNEINKSKSAKKDKAGSVTKKKSSSKKQPITTDDEVSKVSMDSNTTMGTKVASTKKSVDGESTNSKDSSRSIATPKYLRGNHHYDDSDGENSWPGSSTSEDDDNTVNSNKTSVANKRDQRKIILPKFTRYQMMILLDQDSNETNIEENVQDSKSPSQRITEVLAALAIQAKTADVDSKIMSWKVAPNFSYMSEEFPTDVADIALYFNGFRTNFKADKRVYLRVAIHTPNSESKLYANLNSWMKLYGYSFSKCIIQAETSTCIGWLAYSSTYTDTEVIKNMLVDISEFEWGFKMMAVQKADRHLPWLQRARAVGVYVPTPCKDMAINIIGEAF